MKAGMSFHSLPFSVSMHSPFSLFSCGGPHMPPEAQESLNMFTSVILIGSLRFFLSLLTSKVLLLTIMDRTMKLWRKDTKHSQTSQKTENWQSKGLRNPHFLPRQAGEGGNNLSELMESLPLGFFCHLNCDFGMCWLKTKIENWFQFSIYRLRWKQKSKQCHKL